MLHFDDLRDRSSYRSGDLYVHVVAFRPNSGSSWELQVSCYASAPENYRVENGRLQIPEQDRETVRIDSRVFQDLTVVYRDRTGRDLFVARDVDFEKSRWVDVFHSYCFADMSVRLGVGMVAHAKRVRLVGRPCEPLTALWRRFRAALAAGPTVDADLMLSVVGNAVPADLLDVPTDATSYSSEESRVKVEDDVKSEAASPASPASQLFESLLDPDRPPPPPTPAVAAETTMDFLTQAASTPSQTFPHAQPPRSAPESQELHFLPPPPPASLADVHAAQERGQELSLHTLARVPLAAGPRVFRTRARVVGSIPTDLSLVCTKSYVAEHGAVATSDPHFRPLELVLADSAAADLSPANSLSVYIPRARIVAFFGCAHTEQLYTRIEALKPRFARLLNVTSTFDLCIDARDGAPVWTLKDVTLDKLVR